MPNLLDDYSGLHNFKQREGLNTVHPASVSDYMLERRLIRTLNLAAEHKGITKLAKKTRLGPIAVTDVVEDYCYRLETKNLRVAVQILDELDVYSCIRFIHSLGDSDSEID
jgi:hypothetical protein